MSAMRYSPFHRPPGCVRYPMNTPNFNRGAASGRPILDACLIFLRWCRHESYTTPKMNAELVQLQDYPIVVASQELLHLYKLTYVNWLEDWIGIPRRDSLVLTPDANEKYIHDAESDVAEHVTKAVADSG